MASDVQTYYDTQKVWRGGGLVVIVDATNTRIASFSIEFMTRGHVNTWDYIKFCISCCITTDEYELRRMQSDGLESPIQEIAPVDGIYRILLACGNVFRIGPRLRYGSRAPIQDSDSSSLSRSSRSSANQNRFRYNLAVRDHDSCIVSDLRKAGAAHILPLSRPEYYAEAFGMPINLPPTYLYDVSYGFFLSKTLHTSYDQGEWSLMPDPHNPETLIVHVFYTDAGHEVTQWHGKKIPKTRFHPFEESELPDRRLLAFHYRQCVIKHVRCFSHFPQPVFV